MPPWMPVLSALSAAVIGGVIAPQITQAKERRAARADVLNKVRHLERLRWGSNDARDFRQAIAAFEYAAIIARLPRSIVTTYVGAAERARSNSDRFIDEDGKEDWAISIWAADAVRDALDKLSLMIWHPLLWRPRWIVATIGRRLAQQSNQNSVKSILG